eukprot:gene16648-19778_t
MSSAIKNNSSMTPEWWPMSFQNRYQELEKLVKLPEGNSLLKCFDHIEDWMVKGLSNFKQPNEKSKEKIKSGSVSIQTPTESQSKEIKVKSAGSAKGKGYDLTQLVLDVSSQLGIDEVQALLLVSREKTHTKKRVEPSCNEIYLKRIIEYYFAERECLLLLIRRSLQMMADVEQYPEIHDLSKRLRLEKDGKVWEDELFLQLKGLLTFVAPSPSPDTAPVSSKELHSIDLLKKKQALLEATLLLEIHVTWMTVPDFAADFSARHFVQLANLLEDALWLTWPKVAIGLDHSAVPRLRQLSTAVLLQAFQFERLLQTPESSQPLLQDVKAVDTVLSRWPVSLYHSPVLYAWAVFLQLSKDLPGVSPTLADTIRDCEVWSYSAPDFTEIYRRGLLELVQCLGYAGQSAIGGCKLPWLLKLNIYDPVGIAVKLMVKHLIDALLMAFETDEEQQRWVIALFCAVHLDEQELCRRFAENVLQHPGVDPPVINYLFYPAFYDHGDDHGVSLEHRLRLLAALSEITCLDRKGQSRPAEDCDVLAWDSTWIVQEALSPSYLRESFASIMHRVVVEVVEPGAWAAKHAMLSLLERVLPRLESYNLMEQISRTSPHLSRHTDFKEAAMNMQAQVGSRGRRCRNPLASQIDPDAAPWPGWVACRVLSQALQQGLQHRFLLPPEAYPERTEKWPLCDHEDLTVTSLAALCVRVLSAYIPRAPRRTFELLASTELLQATPQYLTGTRPDAMAVDGSAPSGLALPALAGAALPMLKQLLQHEECQLGLYPLTIAVLEMVDSLLTRGVRADPMPALMGYVLKDVLVQHSRWRYQHRAHRWQLSSALLRLLADALGGAGPRVSGGDPLLAAIRHELLQDAGCAGELLAPLALNAEALQQIWYSANVGSVTENKMEVAAREEAVRTSLELLAHLLERPSVSVLQDGGYGATTTPHAPSMLERLLLTPTGSGGGPPPVAALVSYVAYQHHDIHLAAVRALSAVCAAAGGIVPRGIPLSAMLALTEPAAGATNAAARTALLAMLAPSKMETENEVYCAGAEVALVALQSQRGVADQLLLPQGPSADEASGAAGAYGGASVATPSMAATASAPKGAASPGGLELLGEGLARGAEMRQLCPRSLVLTLAACAAMWEAGDALYHPTAALRARPKLGADLLACLPAGGEPEMGDEGDPLRARDRLQQLVDARQRAQPSSSASSPSAGPPALPPTGGAAAAEGGAEEAHRLQVEVLALQ